ncbi:hypothetical protein ALC62_01514 [Cyphomyrmex costatus]|uniref:Uncharacterized protein n=1 Tax=Cyphomyrmex costatus TaxID=456900 RepID=A0A195D339_9HYME|nr:hypothetical protein ALC62_01514 [Cyphomyrmex costatus]
MTPSPPPPPTRTTSARNFLPHTLTSFVSLPFGIDRYRMFKGPKILPSQQLGAAVAPWPGATGLIASVTADDMAHKAPGFSLPFHSFSIRRVKREKDKKRVRKRRRWRRRGKFFTLRPFSLGASIYVVVFRTLLRRKRKSKNMKTPGRRGKQSSDGISKKASGAAAAPRHCRSAFTAIYRSISYVDWIRGRFSSPVNVPPPRGGPNAKCVLATRFCLKREFHSRIRLMIYSIWISFSSCIFFHPFSSEPSSLVHNNNDSTRTPARGPDCRTNLRTWPDPHSHFHNKAK